MKTVGKTFLRAKILHADQIKKQWSMAEWAGAFKSFHDSMAEVVHQYAGRVVKLFGDGFLASFDDAQEAVQAAIDMQEALSGQSQMARGSVSIGIGIASGQAYAIPLDDDRSDFLGAPVDIAEGLCQKARGLAILMNHPVYPPDDGIRVQSQAGSLCNRLLADYFVELPSFRLPGMSKPLLCYTVIWQVEPARYLAYGPMEDSRPPCSGDVPAERVYFGRVSAYKKERGFGFIQFYTEEQIYKEIYFHMTYVINQVLVHEHDHVQFVIKPGKEERPQACAVLVMGSRHHGQVESIEPDGSGFITIRNHDSELIRFFMLPHEQHCKWVQGNDIVEFTVGSGSDLEGLVALDVRPYQNGDWGHSEISGDNLKIGSTERAVVSVYFSEKGYGFAKCRRNNIYVHVSELTNPENVPSPGDLIEFQVNPGRDGTYRASNILLVIKNDPDSLSYSPSDFSGMSATSVD